jgi:hypothetical protein
VITPDATIMHLGGASGASPASKTMQVARARTTLMRRHWGRVWRPLAGPLMWLWGAMRRAGAGDGVKWREVWEGRMTWLAGY